MILGENHRSWKRKICEGAQLRSDSILIDNTGFLKITNMISDIERREIYPPAYFLNDVHHCKLENWDLQMCLMFVTSK